MSGADTFAVKVKTGQELTSVEDRAARRATIVAKRWHNKLIRHGMPGYVEGVIQEINGKSGACYACKRPFRTDRAFRAMEKAVDREIGTPGDALAALMIRALGVRDESEAREAVELKRSIDGVDGAAVEDMARKILENRGWTCLKPTAQVSANGGGA